ncbi:hypothetical protein ACOSQ3_002932 [Xanthoceras sorbifolium]
MKLENMTIEDQMASPFGYIKRVAAATVVSLTFTDLFGGFIGLVSVILTSIVLILSTVLFTFTKQKPAVLVQKSSVTEEVLVKSEDDDDQEEIMMMTMSTSSPSIEEEEDVVPTLLQQQQQPSHNQTEHDHDHEYSIRSSPPELLSESESLDDQLSTSEDYSEVDWPFQDIVYQSLDCSDGSISDEESLIEIALPSGHYVNYNNKEEEEEDQPHKLNKVPDFLPQSILKQHSLMELLAELNDMNIIEEDNLIEIDISMGSIKCSRFEIEA